MTDKEKEMMLDDTALNEVSGGSYTAPASFNPTFIGNRNGILCPNCRRRLIASQPIGDSAAFECYDCCTKITEYHGKWSFIQKKFK